MDRPQITRDRLRAEAARRAAAERAAHAALVGRRAAAARRRAIMATVLLVATVAGWVAVASGVVLIVAAIPTVVLVAVLVMGRRAVIAGLEADRAWDQRSAEIVKGEETDRVTGRAVRPSGMLTEMIPAAAPASEAVATAASGVAASGMDWMPIPVPAPTYTLKAEAPRRDQSSLAPMGASTVLRPEATSAEVPAREDTDNSAIEREVTVGSVGLPATGLPAATATSTVPAPSGSIDIDAVLARRRASGE